MSLLSERIQAMRRDTPSVFCPDRKKSIRLFKEIIDAYFEKHGEEGDDIDAILVFNYIHLSTMPDIDMNEVKERFMESIGKPLMQINQKQ